MHRRKKQQAGFAVAVELLFISCCVLCVAVIAWAALGPKIVAEMSDIGSAVASLNITFQVTGARLDPSGMSGLRQAPNEPLAVWAGSSFTDNADFCDQGCDCGVVMCIPPTAGPEAHPP